MVNELIFEVHNTNVRQTSLQSYLKLINEDKLKPTQKKVFDFIKKYPKCSDREISLGTGLSINCTTGRRNELLKTDLIRCSNKKYDLTTRRNVLTWEVIEKEY